MSLPSTHKGTPSRVTNHASLIECRDQNCTSSPIPGAVPEIYFDFQGAPYNIPAKQLINAIQKTFLVTSCTDCLVLLQMIHMKHLLFGISCMKRCLSRKFLKIWLEL